MKRGSSKRKEDSGPRKTKKVSKGNHAKKVPFLLKK